MEDKEEETVRREDRVVTEKEEHDPKEVAVRKRMFTEDHAIKKFWN